MNAAPDSTAETLEHSRRVGRYLSEAIVDLLRRSYEHDLSKTRPPEQEAFDRASGRLRDLTYGSEEYKRALADLGPALEHHYAANRHHPEHYPDGVAGMTLMDVMEMLADWKAATERHADGDLARSLVIQRERFGIDRQLWLVLVRTAEYLGWVAPGAVDA